LRFAPHSSAHGVTERERERERERESERARERETGPSLTARDWEIPFCIGIRIVS